MTLATAENMLVALRKERKAREAAWHLRQRARKVSHNPFASNDRLCSFAHCCYNPPRKMSGRGFAFVSGGKGAEAPKGE